MRAGVAASITALVTSPKVRAAQRAVSAARRTLLGRRPTVLYFHDHCDPYSALTAAVLAPLQERYAVAVRAYAVSPPDTAAAPDVARLSAYAVRDAALVAQQFGVAPLSDPDGSGVPADTPQNRAEGDAVRARLGHYLGATFFFEGEWYWGLDRLAYLEERLASLRRDAHADLIAPRPDEDFNGAQPLRDGVTLEFFASLRSPYTYLALARAAALARAYGAGFAIRFVLPMVMRGLPVPQAKRLYIVRDCKREAERLGLPFGRICDPVGAPTERGLAVLHHAMKIGRGEAFLQSFLQGVFADGLDAGSEAGLSRIAARAGVSDAVVRAALKDPTWRAVAEANRDALLGAGLWGVPSFRVVMPDGARAAHWGQDRLWAVECDLRVAMGAQHV